MSEGGDSNIDVAHHLSEHRESSHSRGHEIVEIAMFSGIRSMSVAIGLHEKRTQQVPTMHRENL
jgi:hypothetical protein